MKDLCSLSNLEKPSTRKNATSENIGAMKSDENSTPTVNESQPKEVTTTTPSNECSCRICTRLSSIWHEKPAPHATCDGGSQTQAQPERAPEKNNRHPDISPGHAESMPECPTPKRTKASNSGYASGVDSHTLHDVESFGDTLREARDSLTKLLNRVNQLDFEERRLKIEERKLLAQERCAAALETLAQGSLEFLARNLWSSRVYGKTWGG